MAFREKIAWSTLITMAVAYSIYFILLAGRLQNGPPTPAETIWLFGPIAAAQALAVILLHIALSLHAGPEARAAADERDKAIARHGAYAAYFVLLTGMILVGVVMPFDAASWKIVNTALLAIIAAEAVRLVVTILSYRRGWHG